MTLALRRVPDRYMKLNDYLCKKKKKVKKRGRRDREMERRKKILSISSDA